MHKNNKKPRPGQVRPPQKRKATDRENNASRTQCESWQKILSEGKHDQRKTDVVRLIDKHGPMSCRELANLIGNEPSSNTAALQSLEKAEVLHIIHEKYVPKTNRWVSVYAIKTSEHGQ